MERPSPAGSLDSVTDAEWNRLWPLLRLHVRKRYSYLKERYSLDGIIHHAIINTLNGKRRYPPIDKATGLVREDVTLFAFLCETIRSHVSHLNEHDQRIPPPSSLDELENPALIPNIHKPRTPFLLRSAEPEASYELFVTEALKLVEDDPLLSQMVKLWAADPEFNPRDMEVELGVKMNEIRAAQKRLRRRLTKLGRKTND